MREDSLHVIKETYDPGMETSSKKLTSKNSPAKDETMKNTSGSKAETSLYLERISNFK
jgi:hypothetical protein